MRISGGHWPLLPFDTIWIGHMVYYCLWLGGVEVGEGGTDIYKMSFLRILKSVECPVEVCPARAKTLGRLRENFMYRHWKSKVDIIKEGPEPLPQCDQCGMHMTAAIILKHRQSDKCHKAMERRIRQRDVDMAETCGEMYFSMEGR